MSDMRKLLIVCGLMGLPWISSGQAPDPYRDPLDSLLEWLAPNLQDPVLDSLAYRYAHIARHRSLAEDNDTAIARSYLYLAEWHNYHADFFGTSHDSAIYYDYQAIDAFRAMDDAESVALQYYYLGLDYDGLGRYLEAEEASLIDLTDRLKSLEREKLIKYETAQKEATIAAQEVRLQQQERIQHLTAGIIALLVLLLASLFWIFRNNRKRNQQLAQLNGELQATNDQLSKAKEEARAAEASAKEANETKSNFLSTVSHELRTPLTSVLGFTRIVRKRFTEKIVPALPKEDKSLNRTVTQIEKNLDVVVQEGNRLTYLINDVLDLAKIESGRTEWRMEALNINSIIQHAYHATESLFAGKGLTYHERLTDNLPTIHGDRGKLVQVLVNLFSSAVKFTDEGSVTVTSSLENEQVVVRVQDTGIGIASEDLGKVFEKFRQGGDTLTDKPQGTGLGLPICQEIIQHLNGDIWVESTPGTGSTFGFVLPTAQAAAQRTTNEKLEALLKELRRKIPVSEKFKPQGTHRHILVVDKQDSAAKTISKALIAQGYQVIEADAQSLLNLAKSNLPDAIILNASMENQEEIVKALRFEKDLEAVLFLMYQ